MSKRREEPATEKVTAPQKTDLSDKSKPTTTPHQEKVSELKVKFVDYYRQLPIQKLAAARIGYNEDQILVWRKKDKKFAKDVEAAKAEWAVSKANNVKNPEWLLERVLNEFFKEKKELQFDSTEKLDTMLEKLAKLLP